MEYQAVCRMHGGKSPRALAAAERRGAEAEAVRALERFGVPRAEAQDPSAVFVELIATSAGLMDFYLERVRALEPDELVWGVTEKSDEKVMKGASAGDSWDDDEDVGPGLTDPSVVPSVVKTKTKAAPSAWLQLYDQERDRLAGLCTAALRAGVEDRQVRFAEQQGAMVAGLLHAVLRDLELTAAQEALVSVVVPKHLRALPVA